MEESVLTDRKRQIGLIGIVCAASFLMTFYYSSLNISLGAIANYFGVKVGAAAWLPLLYLLIITSSILGFGKLGDIKGYKKIFIIGIGVFLCGAFLSAVARSFGFLFFAQIIQSSGEAMFSPVCIAILTTYLPSELKGKALGFYATFQGMGFALGLSLGGVIVSNFGWRSVFAMTIPLALLIIFVSLKALPYKKPVQSDTRFDFLGAVLLFLFLSVLLYAVNSGTKIGWGNPFILGLLIFQAVLFIAFILVENKSKYPLLDLNLFKNINFTFSSAAAFLGLAINMGFIFIFPFYLQLLRHFDISKAGVIIMSQSVMMMVIAPIAGNISDRIGSRKVCIFGTCLVTAAFAMFSFLSIESSIFYIVICLVCLGTGMGFFIAPNNKLVMINAAADKQGVASGVYKVAVNAGSSIGIALFMLVLAQVVIFDVKKMNIILSESKNHPDIIMAGFRGVFIFGIALGVLTLVFSFLARDKKEE
ncbi:MAG: MFS transporter [Candidatus Omnitrophota bacterium]